MAIETAVTQRSIVSLNPATGESLTFLAAIRFIFEDPINLWMSIIGGTVMVMSSHGAEQLIVQRVLACKTVKDGRRALALSAVVIFPLFLVFLLKAARVLSGITNAPFMGRRRRSGTGLVSHNSRTVAFRRGTFKQ